MLNLKGTWVAREGDLVRINKYQEGKKDAVELRCMFSGLHGSAELVI